MFSVLIVVIYIAFISLGLPDALLGSAWPSIYQEFDVPVSYVGIITMIIALGTIISSLQSDRLTKRIGTGRVTFFSVLLTAVALFGFSIADSFWLMCVWAIPYGLGAGSVDASLNNYVAINYASKHMSWLHSFWGVGASLGPIMMGVVLNQGQVWNSGYRYIALFQVVLAVIIFSSLPLWKKNTPEETVTTKQEPLKLATVIRIPGAKLSFLTFFCYCAIEQTAGLWASSYLVIFKHVPKDIAASFAGLFFIGIAVGRGVAGFLTMKFNDKEMVRIGQLLLGLGVICLLLPFGHVLSIIGLILIGLGCAPIYPSIIHATPSIFGQDKSQAIIGIQMASAYIGTLLMPPLFGIIGSQIGISWLPVFLLILLGMMIYAHEKLARTI